MEEIQCDSLSTMFIFTFPQQLVQKPRCVSTSLQERGRNAHIAGWALGIIGMNENNKIYIVENGGAEVIV